MTLAHIFVVCGILLILSVLALWGWYGHCLFLFHHWDRSRIVTDLCDRCGAIRFKGPAL